MIIYSTRVYINEETETDVLPWPKAVCHLLAASGSSEERPGAAMADAAVSAVLSEAEDALREEYFAPRFAQGHRAPVESPERPQENGAAPALSSGPGPECYGRVIHHSKRSNS